MYFVTIFVTLRGWCQLQLEGPFCVWSSFHRNFQLLSKQNLLQHPTPLSLVVVREATQRVGLHSQVNIEHAVQSTLPVTSSQVHQSILKTTLINCYHHINLALEVIRPHTHKRECAGAKHFISSEHWCNTLDSCTLLLNFSTLKPTVGTMLAFCSCSGLKWLRSVDFPAVNLLK